MTPSESAYCQTTPVKILNGNKTDVEHVNIKLSGLIFHHQYGKIIFKGDIIIPQERERFLFRKLQEPIPAETIKKANWNFIRYADLERVAKAAGKTFNPSDLEAVAKMPKEGDTQKQQLLFT